MLWHQQLLVAAVDVAVGVVGAGAGAGVGVVRASRTGKITFRMVGIVVNLLVFIAGCL
jgi:hypothetical protein